MIQEAREMLVLGQEEKKRKQQKIQEKWKYFEVEKTEVNEATSTFSAQQKTR